MRLSRWRPVCPECGYSLRGCPSERCPECGVPFPSTSRFFRRWACRRLAWDRQNRGSILVAYFHSLLGLVFPPSRMGSRLALPDHLGRAMRWATGHLVVAIGISAVVGNQQWFLRQLFAHAGAHLAPQDEFFVEDPAPGGAVLTWFLQTAVVWTLAITSVPLVGCILSLGVPGRHRAAKLGGLKLSLYQSASLLVALVCCWAVGCWRSVAAFSAQSFVNASFLGKVFYASPKASTTLSILAGIYGVLWAIGMATNPYGQVRGPKGFVFYAVLYGVTWTMLTRLLFPSGALVHLL